MFDFLFRDKKREQSQRVLIDYIVKSQAQALKSVEAVALLDELKVTIGQCSCAYAREECDPLIDRIQALLKEAEANGTGRANRSNQGESRVSSSNHHATA